MTENQINFLLHFFKNNYNNGDNIARKLILEGECIVAGGGNLWIGNSIKQFITKSETPNAIGCTTLKFDIVNFKKSLLFQDHYRTHIEEKRSEIREIQEYLSEILEIR